MSAEATAALLALGAWLRTIVLASPFPIAAAVAVGAWTLRGQKDYAPRSLGRVVLYSVITYLAAIALQLLVTRG